MGRSEWLSNFLARNIIAPISVSKSVKKYKQIWRKEEPEISPLLYFMQKLADELESKKNIPVEIAMRYGEPNFSQAINKLEENVP